MAAANSIFGRWDDSKAEENIDFMPTILSRFDTIFIVKVGPVLFHFLTKKYLLSTQHNNNIRTYKYIVQLRTLHKTIRLQRPRQKAFDQHKTRLSPFRNFTRCKFGSEIVAIKSRETEWIISLTKPYVYCLGWAQWRARCDLGQARHVNPRQRRKRVRRGKRGSRRRRAIATVPQKVCYITLHYINLLGVYSHILTKSLQSPN